MRAYLTGPDGADFADAARLLRIAGYVVLSMHELSEYLDLRGRLTWAAESVMSADVVIVLPGWDVGSATDVELTLATAIDTPVVDFDEAVSREPELLLA